MSRIPCCWYLGPLNMVKSKNLIINNSSVQFLVLFFLPSFLSSLSSSRLSFPETRPTHVQLAVRPYVTVTFDYNIML